MPHSRTFCSQDSFALKKKKLWKIPGRFGLSRLYQLTVTLEISTKTFIKCLSYLLKNQSKFSAC